MSTQTDTKCSHPGTASANDRASTVANTTAATTVHCQASDLSHLSRAELFKLHSRPEPHRIIDFTELETKNESVVASFTRQLKLHAHVIIRLPPQFRSVIDAGHGAAQTFFKQERKYKQQYSLKENKCAYGFFERPDMGKQLFQVRLSNVDDPWPDKPTDLREKLNALHALLSGVGKVCLSAIGRYISAPEHWDYWDQLCDGGVPYQTPLATTLLDVFDYYEEPRSTAVHTCDTHTDYDLLTIIPVPTGSGGLEVLDWSNTDSPTCWVQPEAAPESPLDCVIMAGQSLQHVTHEFIHPSLHRVVLDPKNPKRLSTPLLLFANPTKLLDPRVVKKDFVLTDEQMEPINSGEFGEKLTRSTSSVTFGKLFHGDVLV
jgi:isopenicillin N synthase-like dioxygenase